MTTRPPERAARMAERAGSAATLDAIRQMPASVVRLVALVVGRAVAAVAWRGRWRCADCGRAVVRRRGACEWYMVDDAVWASAGMRDGYLCIGCLEGRLGFGLCAADFARVPVNAPNERDSRRLADRKRRAVRAGAVRGCGGHRTLDLVREELDDLAHLADDDGAPYALFGSIVLLHYGLRERIGDVDVFVHPAIWHVLATRAHWRTLVPDPADPPILETHADELKVHAFHRWQQRDHPAVCADECRRRAILASGWWLTPLDLIRQHKAHSLAQPGADSDVRQAKHRRDLALIDAHLEATAWRGGPVIRAGEGGELR